MAEHDVFRDGKVHVLADECATCVFRPATRPVEGSRVAGMVRATMDEDGATIVCHSTLYTPGVHNAVCRGWYDRLADRDAILQLARSMNVIEFDPVPGKSTGPLAST